jgi:hypothetical protein
VARRGKSSRLTLGIIIALLLILAAFVGSRLFVTGRSEPFRTVSSLDVRTYLENANSLRGNVYKIEGEVINSLGWSPTQGRLIAVGVENGSQVVPVLVTTNFNHINIQKGQRFIFLLEVDKKGILRTKDMTKS